jgi:phage shock protein PspC (stress-responsive transcriptional regulator)
MVRAAPSDDSGGMTTTPPEAPPGPDAGQPGDQPGPPPQGPRASSEDIRDLARIRRTTGPDKKIAGVAGGLARHLDIDPLVLRVALVVLVFFGGAGLIIYAACWLLVPEDGQERAPFGFDDRTRSIALVIAGVVAALTLVGDTMGGYGFPWPLAIVALIALLVVAFGDRDRTRSGSAAAVQYVPPVPPGPQTQQGWVTSPPLYTPPTTQSYATYQTGRTPNPRKRGPILFWFTLALSALGVGVLGMADVAGAGVADSAYPALVVAICGVMLLVGAFFGRPGGIILVGLLAAIGMAGATASTRWDDRVVRNPVSAAAVQDRYELGAGELVLDLTSVEDLENLDGRTVELDAGLGRIEVLLPEGLDVDAEVHAGLGEADLFGETQDGGGVTMTRSFDGGVGAPGLDLDIEIGLGEVEVHVIDETNGVVR